MCSHAEKRLSLFLSPQALILWAFVLGAVCGFFPVAGQKEVAKTLLNLFTNALRLLSLPVIFLALVTSVTGMECVERFKQLSVRVLFWTVLTTLLAALTALGFFLILQPVPAARFAGGEGVLALETPSYWEHLLRLIPSNPIQPFLEGNVIGVLLLAAALGIGLLTVPGKEKIHAVFSPLLAALLKVVKAVILFLPLAVWSGVVLSFEELLQAETWSQLGLYLAVIIGANLFQGAVVLPTLLKMKGISPLTNFRRFLPALNVAFFSKSSVAAMPVAIRTAEERLGVSSEVSRFVFPICTTINMNGCAAFILSTVLFVSMSQGVLFSPLEMGSWVLIATIAAIGNAGVPMGCFFLSAALLAAMNVPLELMGIILPFYSLIDMIETALNVWSDCSVALLVSKKVEEASQPA